MVRVMAISRNSEIYYRINLPGFLNKRSYPEMFIFLVDQMSKPFTGKLYSTGTN